MNKRILIASTLIVIACIVFMYFILTMGTPKPIVSFVGNASFTGRLRIIKSCPRSDGGILVQSNVNGSLIESRVLTIGNSCDTRILLAENNSVITGIVRLEYNNKSFTAVSSYRVEASGTAADIRVYDSNGKLIWRLEDSKNINATLTCGIAANSFIVASLDSLGQLHISEMYLNSNGVGYKWNKTFSISPVIQFNSILISLNPSTGTLAVASGRSLLILDYYSGAILLGVKDIDGRVVKLESTWKDYYILVKKYNIGEIIKVYKSDNGLWNYTVVYKNKNIVDFKPAPNGEKIAIALGMPLSLLNENSTSKIILVGSDGNVLYETTIKGVIVGLNELKRVNGELYLLLDYVVDNGTLNTWDSILTLLGKNEIVWKYSSLRPVRSTWINGRLLVLEYNDYKTNLYCYSITFP